MLQPVLVRRRRAGPLPADRRRAPVAGGPPGRARHHPGHRPGHRRPRLHRAGAGREPPPPGPDRPRGGGRLPAADRGLRPHPRGGRHAGSARAGWRSPTRCGCSSSRRPSSTSLADGRLTAGHARALLGTPDRGFQEALARRAVAEHLSVRAVEEAVRAHAVGADRRRGRPVLDGRRRRPTRRPPAAAPARPARARGAAVGLPRHAGECDHGHRARQGGGGVRHPRGPRAHLPTGHRGARAPH